MLAIWASKVMGSPPNMATILSLPVRGGNFFCLSSRHLPIQTETEETSADKPLELLQMRFSALSQILGLEISVGAHARRLS